MTTPHFLVHSRCGHEVPVFPDRRLKIVSQSARGRAVYVERARPTKNFDGFLGGRLRVPSELILRQPEPASSVFVRKIARKSANVIA